jgi:sugar lactone lactonase YvrE
MVKSIIFLLLTTFSSPQEELFISKVLTEPGGFTNGIEGPACDKEGNIYAVNFQKQGTIGKVTPGGDCSLFVELPEGSVGNGIRFNSKGEMLIADYPKHNILKVDMNTKEISVFAKEPKMNQPNDIAISSTDILFASDPNWNDSTGNLWRIDKDGKTTLLESNMGTTNGVEVSPDGKSLYVNESVQRNVWAYDLSAKGNISNKRLLINFEDFGLDGMRCDAEGNIYVTRYGKGTVIKLSPKGKILKEITLTGKKVSNVTFGGEDGKTVYVTLADNGNIETFRVDVRGRE